MISTNEVELYLDTLGVLNKLLLLTHYEESEINLETYTKEYLFKHINILLTKEVLSEALTQDLIYIKCYKLYDEIKSLNLSSFTEDVFIIDIILNYVGNIPINIYVGKEHNNIKLGCINLQQLKDLMYVDNELL